MSRLRVILFAALSLAVSVPVYAQVDRHDVRAGNRKFRKGDFKESEIDYRKAAVKDSNSVAAQYNLASSLYRQQDYEGAEGALSKIAPVPSADVNFNRGDVALQKQDYAAAVEAFRESLLLNPGDMDAKENYIYAKKMLENQQNQQNQGGGQDNDRNQDDQQNDQQNQDDNNQNQNDQQNQNGNDDQRNQDNRQNQNDSQMTEQQAQQMLKAIQAKEKDTQDKVNKEKAALLKSKQKDKNW